MPGPGSTGSGAGSTAGDSMAGRLPTWKAAMMAKAERLTLVKSVLLAGSTAWSGSTALGPVVPLAVLELQLEPSVGGGSRGR